MSPFLRKQKSWFQKFLTIYVPRVAIGFMKVPLGSIAMFGFYSVADAKGSMRVRQRVVLGAIGSY